MTHDKIKAAARRRMAASGEPYALARRADITQHSEAASTSALHPDDIRAAAEVHQELGQAYSDSVVAAFIDKVDREVAARVEARLAGLSQPKPVKRAGPRRFLQRRVIRDAVAAGTGALAVAGAVGIYGFTSTAPHSGSHPAGAIAAPRPRAPEEVAMVWQLSPAGHVEWRLVPGPGVGEPRRR
jgi:hypothetical protein